MLSAINHADVEMALDGPATPPRRIYTKGFTIREPSSGLPSPPTSCGKPPANWRLDFEPITLPEPRDFFRKGRPPRISTERIEWPADDTETEDEFTPRTESSFASTNFNLLLSAAATSTVDRFDSGVELSASPEIKVEHIPVRRFEPSRRKAQPKRSVPNPNVRRFAEISDDSDDNSPCKRRCIGYSNPNAQSASGAPKCVQVAQPVPEVELKGFSATVRLNFFDTYKSDPHRMLYWNDDLLRREASLAARHEREHEKAQEKAAHAQALQASKAQAQEVKAQAAAAQAAALPPRPRNEVAPAAEPLRRASASPALPRHRPMPSPRPATPRQLPSPLPSSPVEKPEKPRTTPRKPTPLQMQSAIPRMGLLLGDLNDVNAETVTVHTEADTRHAPHVTWNKGCPIKIDPKTECYSLLTPQELKLCETIRMMPKQYLFVKQVMLDKKRDIGFYKKLDAKKWFKIDVNKTGKIFDWFAALGWIVGEDEQ